MTRLARLESSARILALVKLANVALVLVWGFAVTFVFVRVLPLAEFKAFLLLVAFGNFTISAEFGLTSIIYARLRRYWLGENAPLEAKDRDGGFRKEEIGVIVLFLALLIAAALLLLVAALGLGWLRTGVPLLFFLFFLTACLNLPALLAKRALAAVDGNLLWELLDCGRRVVTIGLLAAMLFGLDPVLSVALQMAASILVIGWAIAHVHRRLGMTRAQWLAFRSGGAHVRAHYLRDITASVLFTMSDIVAYNAPYFTIAAATSDPRPMLVFDFFFKMSRSLSMLVRAVAEAALPRITRAFHAGESARFRQLLLRVSGAAFAFWAVIAATLLILGDRLFHLLFAGHAGISRIDLILIGLALAALTLVSISVYIQTALGRFRHLLGRSLSLLAGSLVSAPLAVAFAPGGFEVAFLTLYALTLAFAGCLHILSLRRLARA